MLYASLNSVNESTAYQPIEFTRSNDIHAPQPPPSIDDMTHQILAAEPSTEDTISNEFFRPRVTNAISQMRMARLHVHWYLFTVCAIEATRGYPTHFPGSFTYPAVYCGKTFNRKDNLRVHFQRVHMENN
ncbi:hypothetical protein BJX63DRAFT_372538 [Aspergillus granulosus]|uniref:C2H2-type domain-containing protein n=1 Tax=Aspergillus granulosus TaxID=176169 RepID=A0ABR4H150_9EURO